MLTSLNSNLCHTNDNFMKKFLLLFLLFIGSTNIILSQSEGGRFAIGFIYGLNKYWGDFTDNQFWWAGDLTMRLNLTSYFSLQGTFNLGQVRYKVDEKVLAKYPQYFGIGANIGDFYPGTQTKIRDMNSIRWMSGEVTASLNLFPTQSLVPYLFGGIGLINWEPKAGNTGYGGALPNNQKNVYDKNKIIFPAGLGFELYLTDNLVLNAKGTYRFGMSEYFDDLSNKEDSKASSNADQLLNFGLGFSYYIFGVADYDKDGLSNSREREIGSDPRNPDTDGDGIRDGDEVFTYYTDPLKPDTDGDGLTDYDEIFTYKTSPIKFDTDADGLSDGEEIARKTDPLKFDSDQDGLGDGDEVLKFNTDPLNSDTDSDGLTDGDEVKKYATNPRSRDTDSDGLPDGDEILVHNTNPLKSDTDNDKLNDFEEITLYKTNPLNSDSDGDKLLDGEEVLVHKTKPLEVDTDGDGLTDGDEVLKYKTNPLNTDTDNDSLSDGDEILTYKTDPLNRDTDGDGLSDGQEILTYKTDPLVPDTDNDKLIDYDEIFVHKTNPLKSDSDDDKLSDGDEVLRVKTDPLNPDTDGDNVIDGDDDCPLVVGVPSDIKGKNGCPEPPKIGTKTDFPDILFVVNTDQFNFEYPGTIRNLMKLLEYVNQCDSLQISIEGHASEEGNAKRNQELSDLRAKKVRQWLIEQGVPEYKIAKTIGYGSSRPKIPEPKGAELKKISRDQLENIRKQNRRITVEVVRTCQ